MQYRVQSKRLFFLKTRNYRFLNIYSMIWTVAAPAMNSLVDLIYPENCLLRTDRYFYRFLPLFILFLFHCQIVVTNTVPHDLQKLQCHKIKTVDISILMSEAIRRIHHKESMSYLFQNVTLEDWVNLWSYFSVSSHHIYLQPNYTAL